MLLYVLFTIIQCIVIILCLSTKTIYTQNFEYGKINGVGSVFKDGAYNTYSMLDLGGAPTLLIIVLFASYILFLVLVYKKKFNIVPTFLFYILSLGPAFTMFLLSSLFSKEAEVVANSIATYGSGVRSSFTSWGYCTIVISIICAVCLSWSFNRYKNNYDKKGITEVKVIKQNGVTPVESTKKNGVTSVQVVKKKEKTIISDEDFKM